MPWSIPLPANVSLFLDIIEDGEESVLVYANQYHLNFADNFIDQTTGEAINSYSDFGTCFNNVVKDIYF